MADLQGLIKDDRLMSIQYDKNHMQKVLDEILVLFQNQTLRLNEIEDTMPRLATKEQFDILKANFLQHEKDSRETISNLTNALSNFKLDNDKALNTMRDDIESTHLSIITETKRMIDESIENFAPNFLPQTNETEETLKDVQARLDKLQEEMDKIPKIQPDDKIIGNDVNALALKVQDISNKLKTYPQMETDVSNLVLQFPTITKRIEKKVNEVINAFDNWKFPTNSGNNSFKNLPNINTFTKNAGTSPRIPEQPKVEQPITVIVDDTIPGNREIAPISLPDSKPTSEEKIEPLEDDKQQEEEQIPEPQHEENNIQLIDDVPQISTQELRESMIERPEITLLSEELPPLPTRSPIDTTISNKNEDPFQINVEKPQKVEIIETHTYKTELKSSQRVVSDIEWLRSAVENHHAAIRQLQTSIRVNQDNQDNLSNNLMRINAAHNSKETQLVAQLRNVQDDIENLSVKVNDSISQLQRKMVSLLATTNDISPQKVEVSKSPKEETTPKVTITKNIRKMEALTPLPTKSISDSANNTQRSEPENERINVTPTEPIRKVYNFTFTSSHFTIDDIGHFVISTIDNRAPRQSMFALPQRNVPQNNFSKEKSKENISISDSGQKQISHIDLYTSEDDLERKFTPLLLDPAGGYEATVPEQILQPERAEELEEPPKVITETRKTIIIDNSKRSRSPYRSPNDYNSHQPVVNPIEISQALIEEKVGKEARRVINELQDVIKEDVKKQLQEMKKEVNDAVILVDNKIDRTFVEKMFNKFRVVIKELNEKIENLQCSFLDWITRDELEIVLQKFLGMINNNTDTAGASSKFHCLLCGRPRAHLAGMLDEAPIPSPNTRTVTNSRNTSSSVSQLPSKPQTAQKATVSVSMRPPLKMSRLPSTKPNSPDRRPRDVIQLLTSE